MPLQSIIIKCMHRAAIFQHHKVTSVNHIINWILDDMPEIQPGADCIAALLLNDPVLELDLTPNRSDCLSVINLAREVSAVLGTSLDFVIFLSTTVELCKATGTTCPSRTLVAPVTICSQAEQYSGWSDYAN